MSGRECRAVSSTPFRSVDDGTAFMSLIQGSVDHLWTTTDRADKGQPFNAMTNLKLDLFDEGIRGMAVFRAID